MKKTENPHGTAPVATWRDWMLPAGASVASVVLFAVGGAWIASDQAAARGRELERARLESVGAAIATAAESAGLSSTNLDTLLDTLSRSAGVEHIDHLGPGENAPRAAAGQVKAVVTLPGTMGSLSLVNGVEAPSSLSGLWPVALLGAVLSLGVAGVAGQAARRTSGLRRVGSALRAMAEGESDPAALRVAERFGPDAAAWNKLLEVRGSAEGSVSTTPGDRRDSVNQAGALPISALDAMPVGLMAFDEHQRLIFCNGAAAAALGLTRSSAIGSPLAPTPGVEPLLETLGQVASGAAARATIELSRGEESRRDVLRATVRSLRRGDDATIMVMLEDITQQRLADEARNGFVAQATHELRAPLTNIRLLVEEAIEVGVDDAQSVARSLNIVNQEARRLERVVSDMLSVSEIEAATMSLSLNDVPLSKMLRDLELDYAAQAQEKSVSLRFALPAKLEPITADREKLALLLHNVVGNAVKYTPEGGAVAVECEQSAGVLTVRVTDNGPGIAPADHERIFQKFYRTDQARTSSTKGTGLGLALAREIARLHGGDITVESDLGRGSTFIVRVPDATRGAMSIAA
jgi:signal transduction histidine kinase